MGEITDTVAMLLEAIEEHSHEITDPILARRVAVVRVQLAELQLHLDNVSDPLSA